MTVLGKDSPLWPAVEKAAEENLKANAWVAPPIPGLYPGEDEDEKGRSADVWWEQADGNGKPPQSQ